MSDVPRHSAPGAEDDPGGEPADVDAPGTLAVLGLGQLGGSFALAARAAGLVTDVVGFGRGEESLRQARELGLAERTTTDPARAVEGAAVVVLALPLRSVPEVVKRMRASLAPGVLVIDVGSVKGTAARDIEAEMPASAAFVACHPLAGTERSGPAAATAALFRGRRCLVCPTARTRPEALERARRLWVGVGAEVVEMPADVHDATMAAVSHLPHVFAFALASAVGGLPPELMSWATALPTTSLRDTLRIAASSPAMWRDIFVENGAALLPMIDRLQSELAALRDDVASGDAQRIESYLQAARAARASLIRD